MSSEPLEALGGEGHQLGDRGEVPVRVGGPGVAEVGRECQDLAIEISAVLVPTQEPADGECVTSVQNARPARAPVGSLTEAISHTSEGHLDGVGLERWRTIGTEKAPGPGPRSVAVVGVADERHGRSRVEWNQARLTELGLAYGEDAASEVHVVRHEAAGLAEAQSRREQQ